MGDTPFVRKARSARALETGGANDQQAANHYWISRCYSPKNHFRFIIAYFSLSWDN